MAHRKKATRELFSEGISIEEIRRMRSMGSDLSRLGYDSYMIRLSKRMSSKSFYKF